MADDDKKKHTRPSPPSDVKVDGEDGTSEVATKSMGSVKISAKVDDPQDGQPVKLKVEYTANNWKTIHHVSSEEWGKQGKRTHVVLRNLKVNHLYKCRLWTIAKKSGLDQRSKQYTGVSFWTNRKPTVELVTPAENAEYDENQTVLFDWKFDDPDGSTPTEGPSPSITQETYQIKYKTETGAWSYLPKKPHLGKLGHNTYDSIPAASLVANTVYYWTVKARDPQGIWSEYPFAKSFYIRGTSSPPNDLRPRGGLGTSRIAAEPITFTWKFRDPRPTNRQTQADIRWRVVGTQGVGFGTGDPGFSTEPAQGDLGWFMLTGTGETPGVSTEWEIPAGYFSPGFLYEWQVRTYDDREENVPSGWSESAQFVAAVAPGSGTTDPPLSEDVETEGALGCGHHRVFVYDRGGRVLRGEIKPLTRVIWGRKRDDIGNAIVDTNGFDQDCCGLLGNLQSWMHELVIFRDGVRVFEGPITRITYTSTSVEVEAKDVMAYLYRRVMRQGYNDAYRRIDMTPKTQPTKGPKGGPYTILGLTTVVDRAVQIALDALAYQDPNVLPYITAIRYNDDAPQSRSVADYSRTAWEEIDDLAATSGLDYTTVGRRIIFWDTHRSIGRLPEMRDGDFSDPVIVTEYGMELANWFAVTNNSGYAGIVYPGSRNSSNWWQNYGPVEMVVSAYGEQEGAPVSTEALTRAERDDLIDTLEKQARLGIAGRYPTPVVVRIPDNSTLNPQINLGINQLIPGVWIPLRATLTCRKFSQWQRLDSMEVEEAGGQEFIRVVMSPAPHGGNDDPDMSGGVEGV